MGPNLQCWSASHIVFKVALSLKDLFDDGGYKPLVGTQCVYVHPGSGMMIVAHVDDFLVLGTDIELRDLLRGLQQEFEGGGKILGYGTGCQVELKFLGRTIKLTPAGIEWEGDQKHAQAFIEKLTAEFGAASGYDNASDDRTAKIWSSGPTEPHSVSNLSAPRSGWRPQKTPGVKKSDVEERIPLKAAESKAYRGLAALVNYMALDRCDIGFATKEISKSMSSPAECDVGPLKRLGRYLVMYPRCISLFRWQDSPWTIDTYSDSDWGGDLVTRRSTIVGCVIRGDHLLMH